jgi:hypothetical protein
MSLILMLMYSLIITAKSIDDHQGFDMSSFMKEISRLKLPNQQITISVQTMDQKALASENGIGLGLPSCRREGIKQGERSMNKKEAASEFYQFIDANCVWSHLHPYDEENILKSEFNVDEKISTQSLHVPIFLISVDSPDPIYLVDLEQAAVVGNMVVVIQNKQSSMISEVFCQGDSSSSQGKVTHTVNGQNPLSAALAAAAEVIGGLAKAESGHRGLPTSPSIRAALNDNVGVVQDESIFRYENWASSRHNWMLDRNNDRYSKTGGGLLIDCSSYLGESPTFRASALSTTSIPSFSTIELEIIHRSRILRSISLTRATKRHIMDNLYGSHDEKVAIGIVDIRALVTQALTATMASDWSSAASYANVAFLLSQNLHNYYFSHIHDLIVTAATTSVESHNKSHLMASVMKDHVEEIDLEDQDSFAYFYTKFVLVCGFLAISTFNGVKKLYKTYKNRKFLM